MSYQVLARKWRPHTFAEVAGQEHVLKALINALELERLHHAYLFTGTRGVGKTTIARILAKCLNCEAQVTAEPCGQCSTCCEIDEGRFVDLIEVDAASRTKVEDTRELLDNVQYAPTRGRYKVYLIDEVHMLSTHSFNALLKTLEEPPPHIKFLLATTDPQKLPITVLSRCLQFNLKALAPAVIVDHLKKVLQSENIDFTEAALWQLARAADGSVRDAMSLTDQAIAYGNQSIKEDDVSAMLGTIDQAHVYHLLNALVENNAEELLAAVTKLADYAPDYNSVLENLLSLLHRVALAQAVPDAMDNSQGDREQVLALADKIKPEDVQLFYQIGLIGRRDLPLAPESRSGLEMVLLRMLAFIPVNMSAPMVTSDDNHNQGSNVVPTVGKPKQTNLPSSQIKQPLKNTSVGPQAKQHSAMVEQQQVEIKPVTLPVESNALGGKWLAMFGQLELTGMTKNLAAHSLLVKQDKDIFNFAIDEKHKSLLNQQHQQRIEEALSKHLGKPIKIQFTAANIQQETPAKQRERMQQERQAKAVADVKADPNVQTLVKEFDGEIQENTITPIDQTES